ncbi:MAG: hypothetical protein ACLFV1_02795 [Thiohalophilus sp.]
MGIYYNYTLSTRERRDLIESLKGMMQTTTLRNAYKDFFTWLSEPALFQPEKNSRLEYSDVFPLIYLKMRLDGIRKNYRNVKHLLVDEMQDYTPVQYAVHSHLFPCKKSILGDYDAAAMVETIEHLKPAALSAAEQMVFAQLRPRVVYLTTPNREYNPLFGLHPGEFREADHEFERDRARFRHWSQGVARRNGYRVTLGGIGEDDPYFGQPTQTAWFTRLD